MKFGAVALLALLLAASGASAYDSGSEDAPVHSATSFGPRLTYLLPNDADRGAWAPGVQVRLHMTPLYAFEASADFAHYTSGGVGVHTTPIQATVIGYFSGDSTFSPYLLIGGGWYPTHADGPYNAPRLFGPHIGAGAELLLGDRWSIDGSYRFLWTETIDWSHPIELLGTDFSVRGHMFTLAVNYRL